MKLGTYKIKDKHPVSSINNKQDLKNGKIRMISDKIKLRYLWIMIFEFYLELNKFKYYNNKLKLLFDVQKKLKNKII